MCPKCYNKFEKKNSEKVSNLGCFLKNIFLSYAEEIMDSCSYDLDDETNTVFDQFYPS